MSITLSEALRLGRENSKCCTEHLHNLERLGKLVETHAQQWHVKEMTDLKIHHVLQLVGDMEKHEYSPSYIRHAVNAVRLASNYASDYYGIPSIKIEQRHLPTVLEAPKIWLTYRQIAKACEIGMEPHYRKTSKHSTPQPMHFGRAALMTCGLCGLRVTEFARLTPDKLDADNNLTITDAKNESSNRVVPIPVMVADAMRYYWANFGQWASDRNCTAKKVRHLLQTAHAVTQDDLYLLTPPKNLRKSFVNQLDGAVEDKYLMAYGGWAFKGTMHRKYQALRPRPDDPPQIRERSLQRLRETVVAAIEKKCEGLHF